MSIGINVINEKTLSNADNKLKKSEKDFILDLLGKTQEQYERIFLSLANSKDAYEQREFMVQRNQLQKLVVPKPTEISVKAEDEQYLKLLSLFENWED